MDIFRGLQNFPYYYAPCVATIGNFDGVHQGHQQILAKLKGYATQYNIPAVVVTFEPYPIEFLKPEQAAPRLTRLREKLILFQAAGVDAVLVLPFNHRLATLTADEFIHTLLITTLGIRLLLIGDDFHFGYQRQGNIQTLKKAADEFGFDLSIMPSFKQGNERISSTLIRQYLGAGNLAMAKELLGKPYSMIGKVMHGAKRGRMINFPTANIQIKRRQSPVLGVYAVEMLGIAPMPVPGVANVGSRPTVDGTRIILEVHLFDFDQDIYGRQVQVNFLHKIRDEKRFDSFEELTAQIHHDAVTTREFFHL